jgi:hypothetical protein
MKVSKISHSLTYVPIHITIRFGDIELGIGTAFFYSVEGKDYLITNWHNVSGRRPWDEKLISKDGAIPNNLLVRIPVRGRTG